MPVPTRFVFNRESVRSEWSSLHVQTIANLWPGLYHARRDDRMCKYQKSGFKHGYFDRSLEGVCKRFDD